MKELKKLKLSSLSKSSLKEREMGRIYGGNYCVWSNANKKANNDSGKCSCSCSGDYYGADGLKHNGDFYLGFF